MLSVNFKNFIVVCWHYIGTYKSRIILLLTASHFTVHSLTLMLQALQFACVVRFLFIAPRSKLLSICLQKTF